MWRDDAYLVDMLVAARDAAELGALGRDALDDWRNERAVLYTLQVIGEAASRVSDGCREANPGIAWTAIVGMRNRIVHGYGGAVDIDIVWDILTSDVPELVTELEKIAPR
jgi:uncharacterized protein with HEPN domain